MGRDEPTHVLRVSDGGNFLIVDHLRHGRLVKEHQAWGKLPPTKEGRQADLLAWGGTFACAKCGPICPCCGDPAVLGVVLRSRPGWGHERGHRPGEAP